MSRRAARTAMLGPVLALAGTQPARAQPAPWHPATADGRYTNPVLFADYSDPDVIRVGPDYWLTASSFAHLPGLPILHSRDLVHWRIVNHALPALGAEFDVPQHGNGVWAPSIRFHDGWYWIYWGDPDRGIYMVRARDPRARWTAPVLVHAAKGWIDATPLWDDDGRAYLVHAYARSRAGIKHRLDVARMSPDGARLLDEGTRVFEDSVHHPTAEGPKFYKRDGWYWIFAPAGGVATGWQLAMRARSPLGPYDVRTVLAQGTTAVNGPHQGAWVTAPDATNWFLHFQDRGAYGRVVHLEPMRWRADGWPVIGRTTSDTATTGEPVATYAAPRASDHGAHARGGNHASGDYALGDPQTSDAFTATSLGLQWQWQANPRSDWYSLAAHPGALRLVAQPLVAGATNLWGARHLLLQKFPAPAFTVTTRLTPAARAVGETFGLVVFGLDYAYVAVRRTADGYAVVQARVTDADRGGAEIGTPETSVAPGPLTLRATVTDSARVQFAYSVDGVRYVDAGPPFVARQGRWVGAKIGLFALAPDAAADSATARGHVDIEFFRVR